MESAYIVEVIITTSVKGKGVDENPYRIVTQVWRKDGILIAEHDPEKDEAPLVAV